MSIEVEQLVQLLENKKEHTLLKQTFFTGTLDNVPVVITVSGIGKVNAGVATALLIEHFAPTLIINTGVSGGYQEDLKTLDVVVATKTTYHDFDVSYDGELAYGQVPNLPPFFEGNQKAIDIALATPIQTKILPGIILSGDAFVTDRNRIALALGKMKLDTAHGIDMESAAIAQICTIQQVPFLIVRSISDVLGQPNQSDHYYQWVQRACENALAITKYVIKNFNTN